MTIRTMARRGNKKQISAYLPESLKLSLESLAAAEGRSLANYLEKLLTEHLGENLSADELEVLKNDSTLLAKLLESENDDD